MSLEPEEKERNVLAFQVSAAYRVYDADAERSCRSGVRNSRASVAPN